MALFLQQVANYAAFEAGFALSRSRCCSSPSRALRRLSVRIGPRLLMAAGPLVGGIGLLGFARLDERADYLTTSCRRRCSSASASR